jgi:PIN domain nuclease of toxin-antitoxin system
VGGQIGDPDNDIVVSIASLWEIAIKCTLRKLRFLEDFEEVMTDEGFALLTITYAHLRMLGDVPQHHRDPFDRLLISQSLAERIPIVTNCRAFCQPSVRTQPFGLPPIDAAVGGERDAVFALRRLARDQPIGDIESDLLGITGGGIA